MTVKAMEKNSLAIAYLYQVVYTSEGDVCLSKACSDKFPGVSVHKA